MFNSRQFANLQTTCSYVLDQDLRRLVQRGAGARERLVLSHVRLVIHIARARGWSSTLSPMDLVQVVEIKCGTILYCCVVVGHVQYFFRVFFLSSLILQKEITSTIQVAADR